MNPTPNGPFPTPEEQLTALLAGELTRAEAQALREALALDPALAREYAKLEAAWRVFDALRHETPGSRLETRVRDAVRQAIAADATAGATSAPESAAATADKDATAPRANRLGVVLAYVAPLAVAAAVLVAVNVGWFGTPDAETGTIASATGDDAGAPPPASPAAMVARERTGMVARPAVDARGADALGKAGAGFASRFGNAPNDSDGNRGPDASQNQWAAPGALAPPPVAQAPGTPRAPQDTPGAGGARPAAPNAAPNGTAPANPGPLAGRPQAPDPFNPMGGAVAGRPQAPDPFNPMGNATVSLTGAASYRTPTSGWLPLQDGATLAGRGYEVHAAPGARLTLSFGDSGKSAGTGERAQGAPAGAPAKADRLHIAPGTTVGLVADPLSPKTRTLVELLSQGRVYMEMQREDSAASVRTPTAYAQLDGGVAADVGVLASRVSRIAVGSGAVRVAGFDAGAKAHPVAVTAGYRATIGVTGQPDVAKALNVNWVGQWAKQANAALNLSVERPLAKGESANPTGATHAMLVAKDPDYEGVPFVIVDHDVQVEIADQVAVTTINEVFLNPTARTLEGVFHFPLPPDATISGLSMWVNGREVVGEWVDRKRAARIYDEYKYRRRDPALLEWMDGNTYRLRIFPIAPGEKKRLKLTYTEILAPKDGTFTYNYPLVSEKLAGNPVEHLRVRARVDAGAKLQSVQSPSHRLDFKVAAEGSAAGGAAYVATIEAQDYVPGRDLTITYRLAADAQKPFYTRVAKLEGRPGHVAGFFTPVFAATASERQADRTLFLVDTSGSMNGRVWSLELALLDRLIAGLEPEDEFNVVTYDATAQLVEPKWQEASKANRQRLVAQVSTRLRYGATNLREALRVALATVDPIEPTTIVLLGDGIASQGEVRGRRLVKLAREMPLGNGKSLAVARPDLRLFPVALGNRYDQTMLTALADEFQGRLVTLGLDAAPQAAAEAVTQALVRPALCDLAVSIDGVELTDRFPKRFPALVSGQQVSFVARYPAKGGKGTITFTGRLGATTKTWRFPLVLGTVGHDGMAIERFWAKRAIDDLQAELDEGLEREAAAPIVKKIVEFSKEYGIGSRHTSLLVLENDTEFKRWNIARNEDAMAKLRVPRGAPAVTIVGAKYGAGATGDIKVLPPGSSRWVPLGAVLGQKNGRRLPVGSRLATAFDTSITLKTPGGKQIRIPEKQSLRLADIPAVSAWLTANSKAPKPATSGTVPVDAKFRAASAAFAQKIGEMRGAARVKLIDGYRRALEHDAMLARRMLQTARQTVRTVPDDPNRERIETLLNTLQQRFADTDPLVLLDTVERTREQWRSLGRTLKRQAVAAKDAELKSRVLRLTGGERNRGRSGFGGGWGGRGGNRAYRRSDRMHGRQGRGGAGARGGGDGGGAEDHRNAPAEGAEPPATRAPSAPGGSARPGRSRPRPPAPHVTPAPPPPPHDAAPGGHVPHAGNGASDARPPRPSRGNDDPNSEAAPETTPGTAERLRREPGRLRPGAPQNEPGDAGPADPGAAGDHPAPQDELERRNSGEAPAQPPANRDRGADADDAQPGPATSEDTERDEQTDPDHPRRDSASGGAAPHSNPSPDRQRGLADGSEDGTTPGQAGQTRGELDEERREERRKAELDAEQKSLDEFSKKAVQDALRSLQSELGVEHEKLQKLRQRQQQEQKPGENAYRYFGKFDEEQLDALGRDFAKDMKKLSESYADKLNNKDKELNDEDLSANFARALAKRRAALSISLALVQETAAFARLGDTNLRQAYRQRAVTSADRKVLGNTPGKLTPVQALAASLLVRPKRAVPMLSTSVAALGTDYVALVKSLKGPRIADAKIANAKGATLAKAVATTRGASIADTQRDDQRWDPAPTGTTTFVIDTSYTMGLPLTDAQRKALAMPEAVRETLRTKLDLAKFEAINGIASLRAGEPFALITFAEHVRFGVFQSGRFQPVAFAKARGFAGARTPAATATVAAAVRFIRALKPDGAANLPGLLTRLFDPKLYPDTSVDFRSKTVYLLTDGWGSWSDDSTGYLSGTGRGNGATLGNLRAYYERIAGGAGERYGLRINPVALGTHDAAGLKRLAHLTGGTYLDTTGGANPAVKPAEERPLARLNRKITELAPKDAAGWRRLIDWAERAPHGITDAPLRVYLAWAKVAPNNHLIYEQLGEYLEAQKRPQDALRAFSTLVETGYQAGETHRWLGNLYRGRGKFAWARDEYAIARQQRPDIAIAYFNEANVLAQTGATEQARWRYWDLLEAKRFPARYGNVKQRASRELVLLLTRMIGDAKTAGKTAEVTRLERERANVVKDYGVDPKFLTASLVIILDWDSDGTDVDLWVSKRTGTRNGRPRWDKCFYQNMKRSWGGRLYEDLTEGFGPEFITVDAAKTKPGDEFLVQIHYYSNASNRIRSYCHVKIIERFAPGEERVTERHVKLADKDDKRVIARITFGK